MLLGVEITTENIVGALATLGSIGGGFFLWYFGKYLPQKRAATIEDAKARVAAKQIEDGETTRPYREQLEKLEGTLAKMGQQMDTFRQQAEDKITAATNHANDCEKRFALMEFQYSELQKRVTVLDGGK